MMQCIKIGLSSFLLAFKICFFVSCATGPIEMSPIQLESETRKRELMALLKTAKIQFDNWQLHLADQSYDRAIGKLRQYYHRNHLFVSQALYNRGEVNRLMGRYDLSEQLFSQAFIIQKKNKAVPSSQFYLTYRSLGLLYQDLGRLSQAEELYNDLLSLQIKTHGKFNRRYARTLLYLADLYMSQGKYNEAKRRYHETLDVQKQLSSEQTSLYSTTLNNLATVEIRLGNYQLAESLYTDALEITKMNLGGKHHEYARTLTNLGYLNLLQGKYRLSEKRCTEALAILQNYYKKAHPDISITLDHLAQLESIQGKYRRAEQLYQQSSKIFQTIYGTAHTKYAISLNNQGLFYMMIGDRHRAEINLKRAIAIAEDALGNEHPKVLAIRTNIGLLQYYQRNYDRAVQEFKQILAAQISIYGENSLHVALTQYNLGKAYREQGKFDQAELFLRRTLSIQEENLGKTHLRVAYTLNSLALVIKKRGDRSHDDKDPIKATLEYRRAHSLYMRALAVATILNNPELLWTTQHQISNLLLSQNKPKAAILPGKQAVNTIQKMRHEIALMDPSLQEKFVSSKEHVYRSLASNLIELGRLPEAEHVINLLKEYEYKKLMFLPGVRGTSSPAKIACDGYEDKHCKRFKEISNNLLETAEEFYRLKNTKSRNANEQARYEKLRNYIVAADVVFNKYYNKIIDSLEERKIFADVEDKEIIHQTTIKPALMETNGSAVWLSYLVGPNHLYIIITTAHMQDARKVKIDSKKLNGLVEKFRHITIEEKKDSDEFYDLARKLYSIIIEPVKEFIPEKKVHLVVFSFDQGLRYLPVAALHSGDNFFVQDYAIAFFTPAGEAKMVERRIGKWQVAGLGITESATIVEPDSTGAKQVFSALRGVQEELDGIIRENESDPEGVMWGKKYIDDEFTLETLEEVLEDNSKHVVHIATHFKFQPGRERQSYLILGGKKILTLEVLNSLPTIVKSKELVALSACDTGVVAETGSGSEIEGLGVILQNKGAKSVLATLWKVDDLSTALFMKIFYELRHSGEGNSKAESLRQAQLAFINNSKKPRYKIPYHWAPFILMGNWF